MTETHNGNGTSGSPPIKFQPMVRMRSKSLSESPESLTSSIDTLVDDSSPPASTDCLPLIRTRSRSIPCSREDTGLDTTALSERLYALHLASSGTPLLRADLEATGGQESVEFSRLNAEINVIVKENVVSILFANATSEFVPITASTQVIVTPGPKERIAVHYHKCDNLYSRGERHPFKPEGPLDCPIIFPLKPTEDGRLYSQLLHPGMEAIINLEREDIPTEQTHWAPEVTDSPRFPLALDAGLTFGKAILRPLEEGSASSLATLSLEGDNVALSLDATIPEQHPKWPFASTRSPAIDIADANMAGGWASELAPAPGREDLRGSNSSLQPQPVPGAYSSFPSHDPWRRLPGKNGITYIHTDSQETYYLPDGTYVDFRNLVIATEFKMDETLVKCLRKHLEESGKAVASARCIKSTPPQGRIRYRTFISFKNRDHAAEVMNWLIAKQQIGAPWDAPRRWIPFLRVEYHKPYETWAEKQARALRQSQR